MAAYLMIENPGVAPVEAFTLLGASTKRGNGNTGTIGKFGSGNKHGLAVLLRHDLSPTVFAGNLKLEFGTRPQVMDSGLAKHDFKRVVVKFGGKDAWGVSRSSTEDMGFVLEYGATDWLTVDLALREFVSNSIDRAIEEGECDFVNKHSHPDAYPIEDIDAALMVYRNAATDYSNVKIEVVNESQVRAKKNHTRIFIPMNAEVLEFYNNIGKWFLHFSEPESLKLTILPKKNRNIGERQTAVVYRRGVRVREFSASETASLFDYNLEDLELDESRKVDDWNVQYAAAKAISNADEVVISRLWQSFLDEMIVWEHSFSLYGLESGLYTSKQREVWNKAFEKVAGDSAVIASANGGHLAARKGYKVVVVPEIFVTIAEKAGIRTPSTVLSHDDREGREVFDATPDAEAAVDFAWNLVCKYEIANGRKRPIVKTFRKIMEGGGQTLGFYRDGIIYINADIAGNSSLSLGWHGLSQQLLVAAIEEVSHHVTGAIDFSKDVQNFALNLVVCMAKEMVGI